MGTTPVRWGGGLHGAGRGHGGVGTRWCAGRRGRPARASQGHDRGAVFASCMTRLWEGASGGAAGVWPSGGDGGLGVWERMSCGLCFASVYRAGQNRLLAEGMKIYITLAFLWSNGLILHLVH
jgi:hypothetical protein